MVAYGAGCVVGLLAATARAVEAWAAAETAFIRVPTKVRDLQSALVREVDLAGQRIEEILLLAGDVARAKRLLGGIRELRFVIGEGCHHDATRLMPPILVLANECTHDLVDRHVETVRAISRDLMLSRFPESVRPYFEESRDALFLQHDEGASLAACRGLERGCRDVAAAHSLALVAGNGTKPLASCDLRDVLEALACCHWSDGTDVLDKAARALAHFLRQMRNVAGHAASTSVEEWRETAVLAAAATCRLLERSAEPGQSIAPTAIIKNW